MKERKRADMDLFEMIMQRDGEGEGFQGTGIVEAFFSGICTP